jgi:hypothetical protein
MPEIIGLSKSISGFDPRGFGGCALWLDAADSNTVTGTTTVTEWRDKSGNGRNLGVGSGTTSYANNGITLANSYMFVTSAVNLSNFTFFIVARSNSGTNNQTVFGARPNTSAVYGSTDGFGFYLDSTNNYRFYGGSTINVNRATNVASIFSFSPATGVIYEFFNGGFGGKLTGEGTRTTTAQGFAIGGEWQGSAYGNFVSTATIYEVIVYNSTLTTSERQFVESYLSTKWDISLVGPSALYRKPAPVTRRFNPVDVPGCILWLDGADQSTTGPVGSIATGWLDKSGNANNMSAVGTITVETGGGMYLGGSAYFSRGAAVVTGVHTIFVVFVKGDGNGPLYYTTSGVNGNNGFFPNYAGTMYLAIGPPGYWYTIGNQFSNNTSYVASITYTGSTTGSRVELYQNGSLVVSTTLTGNLPDPFNAFYLGYRTNDLDNAFTGYMYEVVAYSNVLSSSQRQQVEGYLSWKWGALRAYLPTTHSFKTIPPSSPAQFMPNMINGCELWLDAADPTVASTASANWFDKSGRGNNFQLFPGTLPVTVDGANRVVSLSSGTIMQSALDVSFTTSSAFYIVFRLTALSPTGINSVLAFPSINPSGNVGDYSIRLSGAGLIGTPANPGGVNDLAIANYFVNGFFNPDYPLNAYYVNSYAIVGTTLPSRSGTSKITLSSSFFSRFFTGNIAEVLYYPNGLTTFQRQQVEGYLASKWGLSEKLPTTHPFYKFPPAYSDSSLVVNGGSQQLQFAFSNYSYFTSSSNFIVSSGTGVVNYLVVGGGGGGGDRHGGGGGGGGVVSGKFTAVVGTYTITVGAGGDGGYYEANNSSPRGSGLRGGDSSISGPNITTITALGGGGGGTYDGNPTGTFSSGGGGGGNGYAGIAGTAGQGNSGGSGLNPAGGGGGGAGAAGSNANLSTGGIGTSNFTYPLRAAGYGTAFGAASFPNSVISNQIAYIGGGGGGGSSFNPGPGGTGGVGGGGRGSWNNDYMSAGTPNTGGGGGGCRSANEPSSGFSGGSGVVLLWY